MFHLCFTQNFNAAPDPSSLLYQQMVSYIDDDPSVLATNISGSYEEFFQIFNGIVTQNGDSALWFYASAGATVLSVAVLMFLRRMPRDRYEWGVIIARLILGVGISLLSIFDIGSSAPFLNIDSNFDVTETNARIWRIEDANWMYVVVSHGS